MVDQADGAGELLRAADADRERVAGRLRQAHAEGRIDLAEFDERVAAAYAARTYAELTPITADLPVVGDGVASAASSGSKATPSPGRKAARRVAGRRTAAPVAAWASVSLLNLVIWALVSVGTGAAVYPWWIWVAGPWGVLMLLGLVAPRARPCR